jgi:hypothetical protein
MTRRPTFINIGPGRCATSWLYEILKSHPEVAMASVKETEYFNTNYEKGHRWYERHFPTGNEKAVGEISNNYYLDPAVARRIHQYNPDTKIMLNVRNPTDLLRSFYQFGVRRGIDMQDCNAVLNQPIGPIMGSGYEYRLSKRILTASDTCSLLDSVRLATRLQPFFELFPSRQIYVLIYDRLKTESELVLQEIYDFIEVDSTFRPRIADQIVNTALTPKCKTIAKIATRTSFMLRRFGLYSVINALKENRLVKSILYSDKKARDAQADVLCVIPPDILRELDLEKLYMTELYPPLATWWRQPGSRVSLEPQSSK